MRFILDIFVAQKGIKRLKTTLNKSGILTTPSQL